MQHTSKDAGTTTSSSLAFKSNNTVGNWIAVCIRAGKSNGQVFTVTDSKGNTYRRAVQLSVTVDTPNGDTLGIFYAENIKGGANTVTVSDTILGALRFAILEYSGVAAANSLDVAVAAQGIGGSPNSGNVPTTLNGALLLGAIMTANAASFGAGSGYTIEDRVPVAPNTKLIVEDQVQLTAGTASASASLGASDAWGAALAAFRAASGGGPVPTSITNLSPTSGPVGTPVTIAGTSFGGAQELSTVTFNGTLATPTSWGPTSIVAPVPSGATTGNVVVTVGGVPSNGASFTVTSGPTYALSVSISSDRNYASGLQGASLLGYAYVFTSYAAQLTDYNPAGIVTVSYWLDNPAMTGPPTRTESVGPYDFAGERGSLAAPWNTTTLPDGTHSITQLVQGSNGSTEVGTATFTIQNNLSTVITSGHYEYVVVDQNMYVYSLDDNFQLVKHVTIPQVNGIRGIGAVPSTHMLYIAYGGNGGATGNGSLLKYDLLTDTVVWTQSYPFGIDSFSITPDGVTIYMPSGSKSPDGIWRTIDALAGNVAGSINTGMNGAHNTIMSLDGAYVFMGPRRSAYLVSGITSTNQVALNIGPLRQDVRPFTINGKHSMAFTTASTNGGSGLGFQVSDTATGTVLYSLSVPGFSVPASFPDTPCHGISLSPDETEIYLIDISNAYVHVFDVRGLPSSAPVLVASIPLTTNFSGFESPCITGFDCEREGWLRHTRDGRYVLVGDSGDIVDTITRQVVGAIPQLLNTRHGNLEIDWLNGVPVSTTTHYGLGYVIQ